MPCASEGPTRRCSEREPAVQLKRQIERHQRLAPVADLGRLGACGGRVDLSFSLRSARLEGVAEPVSRGSGPGRASRDVDGPEWFRPQI